MTYDAQKIVLGREPITIVELDIGYCSLEYGVSPCSAAVGVTGTQKCFNTRFTCQDAANYTEETKTYRFCQPLDNHPIGIDMIPSIDGKVSRAPTSTTAGKGLGNRAVAKVTLSDHAWHDRDVDKYFDERTYVAEETGTYWGKWLARNPYYEQREMRVLSGYVTDPWDWGNFETETYDITSITGPTRGKVTITGKDILSRTYSDKVKYPQPSNGELLSDITDSATAATLTPTGIGNDEYPASGYISFGKEICAFTRSGDALTLVRAQWGTAASAHSAGDTGQICKSWNDSNVVDVLDELLTTGAGIPSSYIPYGIGSQTWDDEKALWLNSALATGILMKPESISDVIEELSESFIFDIGWDLSNQEVMIKALSPEPSGVSINSLSDNYDIIADSVTVSRDPKQRVSTCRVFYDKIDYSEKNDIEQFDGIHVTTDTTSEGSELYGSSAIKDIYSRWINNKAQAVLASGRYVARFSETPIVISFELDNKDDDKLSMAQRVEIDTKHIQGITGENNPTKFQITEIAEKEMGATKRYSGIISTFTGRYGFVAPDATPNYSSASDAEKNAYGFISKADGTFDDGTSAYKII